MTNSRRLVYKRNHALRQSRPTRAARSSARRAAVARADRGRAGAGARRLPVASGAHRKPQPAGGDRGGGAARVRGVPRRRARRRERAARDRRQGPGADALVAARALVPIHGPVPRLRLVRMPPRTLFRAAAALLGNARGGRAMGCFARLRGGADGGGGALLRHVARAAPACHRGERGGLPARPRHGEHPGPRHRAAPRRVDRGPVRALGRGCRGAAFPAARQRNPDRVAALRHAAGGRLCCRARRAGGLRAAAHRGRPVRLPSPQRMSSELRPLSAVPFWICAVLALALGVQIASRLSTPALRASADLPPPPRPEALRLASFAEEPAAARLAMLYLQAFDYRGDNRIPYQKLDYGRLIGWLGAILALDPRSDYPLFSAARIYAENPDPARSRQMLEYVYRAFLDDPTRRWPWLAHAALLAKHRLHDLPLALRYARAVERDTTAPTVPPLAKRPDALPIPALALARPRRAPGEASPPRPAARAALRARGRARHHRPERSVVGKADADLHPRGHERARGRQDHDREPPRERADPRPGGNPLSQGAAAGARGAAGSPALNRRNPDGSVGSPT